LTSALAFPRHDASALGKTRGQPTFTFVDDAHARTLQNGR
jgi:hypothetical protein